MARKVDINVKALRERLKLSQAEFGKKLGVSHASVSHWESGKRRPSGSAKILLAELSRK